jgi:hypothetical protein
MIKKISVLMSSVLLSTSTFAFTKESLVTSPLGIPLHTQSAESLWSLGIEALWMMPTNSDFQYAQIQNTQGTSHQNNNQTIHGSYHSGGAFDATYHFQSTGSDLQLALLHLDMRSGDNKALTGSRVTDAFNLTNHQLNDANVNMDNSLDQIDLVFGQNIAVGNALLFHPFAGLRYISFDNQNVAEYYRITTQENPLGYGRLNSSFDGLGPRLGVDVHYPLFSSHFSVVGTVATSLLIGNIDAVLTETEYEENPVINKTDQSTHIVPELDAQIGLNYHYGLNMRDSLDLTLGYQVANYVNLVQQNRIDITTPNSINQYSNLGYEGIYLRTQLNLS